MKSHCLVLGVLATFLPTLLAAQAPDTLSFQGRLTNPGGDPINTTTSMVFKLYKDGSEIWSETHPSVTVTDGVFNVYLGGTTPLDTVAFNREIELGIKVGADSEISPRTPLTGAAFALGMRGMYAVFAEKSTSSSYNVVGGHSVNHVGPGVIGGTISGGGRVISDFPRANVVNADFGVIAGGEYNVVESDYGIVGGGHHNNSRGTRSVIDGGSENTAGGDYSVVGGGSHNITSGDHATVPGGWVNAARGDGSFASGVRAKANHDATFVWSDLPIATSDTFATTGTGQFLIRASGGVGIGTNAPAGALHVTGGSGDVDVLIEADTEDAVEDDNPMLRFRQDGGLTGMNLGFDEANFGSNIFGIGRRVSNVDYDDTFLIEAASGDVGIGTKTLSNRLHVSESVNGSGDNEVNYVTWIESPNTGNNPDILALGAGTASPGTGVNYIGFFAAGNLIGQIEGGGTSVVYNTMGADYAELLPRAAVASDIEVGSIVGVRDGQVALDTRAAQRVMVVTDRPAVLGNAQAGEDGRDGFEPIAFIGQVPVKVRGLVEAGDYIVPSGQPDGIGWAVSPQDLRVADLGKVVGVAWESSDDPALKRIIVEVGLDRAAAAGHAFQRQIGTLKSETAELRERMAKLERVIGS